MAKKATEQELILLLAVEDCVERLLRKKYSGYRGRYGFMKEPLLQLRRERVILEAAMNGDTQAVRRRAGGVNGNSQSVG